MSPSVSLGKLQFNFSLNFDLCVNEGLVMTKDIRQHYLLEDIRHACSH